MKLYHYSNEPYSKLLTLSLRGKNKGEFDNDSDDPYAYNKSMSFFFEPIPRDLPTILEHKHQFWVEGKVLYEHVVDTQDLPTDTRYHIVETRERNDLMYSKAYVNATTPTEVSELIRKITELELLHGYVGENRIEFEKALRRVRYDYRKDYSDMVKRDKKYPNQKLMTKYAATVPHAMIYIDVPVKVEGVREFVLGAKSKLNKW